MNKTQHLKKLMQQYPNWTYEQYRAKTGASRSLIEKVKRGTPKSVSPPVATQELTSPMATKRQVGGDHYLNMGVQPWDVVDTWPAEQRIGAYRFALLKYTMRMGTKGLAEDDAAKAHHYAQKLTETLNTLRRRDEDS